MAKYETYRFRTFFVHCCPLPAVCSVPRILQIYSNYILCTPKLSLTLFGVKGTELYIFPSALRINATNEIC